MPVNRPCSWFPALVPAPKFCFWVSAWLQCSHPVTDQLYWVSVARTANQTNLCCGRVNPPRAKDATTPDLPLALKFGYHGQENGSTFGWRRMPSASTVPYCVGLPGWLANFLELPSPAREIRLDSIQGLRFSQKRPFVHSCKRIHFHVDLRVSWDGSVSASAFWVDCQRYQTYDSIVWGK